MTTEAEPKKPDEEEEEGELPQQEMNFYLKPQNTYVVIEKEWVLFTALTALTYLIHLVWMCYGVDVYASYERHIPCTGALTLDDASSVYDVCVEFPYSVKT